MGQRSPTETLFGIVTAFIDRRTWSQAELARRLEVTAPAIRKRLEELRAAGLPLEREEDHPHVYWSVPKGWFPGALLFKDDEVPLLLRVLARSPRDRTRDKLIALVVERLSAMSTLGADAGARAGAVHTTEVDPDEEKWLSVLEDAAAQKVPVRLRYFTASRGDEAARVASVHRVEIGARPRFVATCHRDDTLKWFRLANVSHATLVPNETFRSPSTGDAAVDAFVRESVDGFHETGPVVRCTFTVRRADAAWVARNLPLPRGAVHIDTLAGGSDGLRVTADTTAVHHVARFVVGLGEAATCETPELARAVAALARGALANHGDVP